MQALLSEYKFQFDGFFSFPTFDLQKAGAHPIGEFGCIRHLFTGLDGVSALPCLLSMVNYPPLTADGEARR